LGRARARGVGGRRVSLVHTGVSDMKNTRVVLLVVGLLIPLLAGCTTVATPVSPSPSGEVRSTKTVSYVIGRPAKAYENFEILYSGTSSASIRLLYREYTRLDLVRPGFSQELNYPADAKQIRFKGMLIDILSIGLNRTRFSWTSRRLVVG
jgi:hypothetical protein